MISALLSRLVILVFGTLYPAYSSYKAVKTKDIKLYVKWMMYWIVFALFTAIETFTDIFFSFWFPFYYELKVIIVIWLLSPVTRGSSIIYRKVIHPLFMRREQEIDDMIAKAKDQGYNVILDIGCKGMTLATHAIMNTAVKGGSGLLFQLRKSYSLNDLINNDIIDSPRDKQLEKKLKDCKNNFRGNEVTETRMISAESQADLDNAMDGDSSIYCQEYFPKLRKSSCESISLEKDCNEITSNLRLRRNQRQEAEHMKLASSPNSIFPYYPFISRQYSVPPLQYYSSIAKTNYALPSRNFKSDERRFRENFLNMKLTTESCHDMKKISSMPDISASVVESTSNWMLIDSNPSPLKNMERKKSRKRAAPKPPAGTSELPSVCVNPSDLASPRDEYVAYVNDVDYLAPYKRPSRPKRQKSKIQQFLSKSRELLTQWKHEAEYDSYSVRSERVDGSSDDSISTTSSYNTVN